MSKRKLTRQQAWRVAKIQAERAQRAARRDSSAQQALSADTLGPEQEGTVVAHFGAQLIVEAQDGSSQRCHLRTNLGALVTGDRVVWCAGVESGVVVAQLPRTSELCRPDARGALKPVAANIDRIFVVIAPRPEPHANLLDRYLVAAETLGVEPVIVLNKSDLLDTEADLSARIADLLAIYRELDYRVVRTSTRDHSVRQLDALLRDHTSVVVGQSGVGKSSLVNALVAGAQQRVAELSAAGGNAGRGKGMHTTTTAQLLRLACGGALIDSPGIREFGLWHLNRQQVQQGFRELRPLSGHCRFRDCRHEQEPGCAILDARERGVIAAQRLDSYRHIVASLEAADSDNG